MNRMLLMASTLCVAALAAGDAWAQLETAASERTAYGAHVDAEGWVHFRLHAPDAERVELLLFDAPKAVTPAEVVPLQPADGDWQAKVRGPGVGPGTAYMFRAAGPLELKVDDQYGRFFNEHYLVNDAYAYRTQNVRYAEVFASTPFVDMEAPVYAGGGKSLVYDHAADGSPGHVMVRPEDLIVYELHVQDYTARIESLEPGLRGTYVGLARSGLTTPGGLAAGIDHLVELGVTAVQLMPVMEYDEDTGNDADRLNHWGYMTTNFFAPEVRYAATEGEQVVELKQLVRAFHERGIAVFMDVVYNHTGEQGPWVADGRLAAKCYNLMCTALQQTYRSTPDGRWFFNATGTGNDVSFAGANRFTKRLVTDSLGFWRQTYGIDGFRFDLARILADGSFDAADWVDNDPDFNAAHLHAEPWDLGGVWWDYMDNFGWGAQNNRWAKWIGRYRDQVRRFSRSDLRDPVAFKLLIEGRGLADGHSPASSKPWRSVNFVAVHDGYTLRDCTLFNDAGGSHNCWDSGGDENLRRERSKQLLGVLLTSQGVPLILQGDEFGRTKSGARSQAEAHNTYNYESTTGDAAIDHVNWIDWRLKDGDGSASPNAATYGRELFHWTRDLIALRKRWSHFRRQDFAAYVADAPDDRDGARNDGGFTYAWEGPGAGEPSQIAVVWWGAPGEPDLMVVYNEHWDPFELDNLNAWSNGGWRVLARSWFGDEADVCDLAQWETSCPEAGGALELKGRSMAILASTND